MFSYFFDTTPEPEEVPSPPPSRFAKVNKNALSGAENKESEKYKIDPGYYFKHLEPKQIENVVTNFNQEIQTSQKKFKDTLMVKYQNVLQCENEFKNMCDSSVKVQENCGEVERSIKLINHNYTSKIMEIVNQ